MRSATPTFKLVPARHAAVSSDDRAGHGTRESCSLDASGELLLEHHDERLTDCGLDLAIGASSGAQKTQGNYCTICCTIPDTGGWLAGSLAISSTQRDDVSADRQWEGLRILAKSAQVSDRKTVAPRIETFTQVLILRILSVCGEVAEWPKAAVC